MASSVEIRLQLEIGNRVEKLEDFLVGRIAKRTRKVVTRISGGVSSIQMDVSKSLVSYITSSTNRYQE